MNFRVVSWGGGKGKTPARPNQRIVHQTFQLRFSAVSFGVGNPLKRIQIHVTADVIHVFYDVLYLQISA